MINQKNSTLKFPGNFSLYILYIKIICIRYVDSARYVTCSASNAHLIEL